MVGFFAPFTVFTSLKVFTASRCPLVFFSSTFILTAASALWVKRASWESHRWSAVGIGFIGVVIAMNPQGGGPLSYYLLVLCAGNDICPDIYHRQAAFETGFGYLDGIFTTSRDGACARPSRYPGSGCRLTSRFLANYC